MAVRTTNRATVADGPETDRLLARLELIADAEEHAATAEEQARLAADLAHESLPCAGVMTLAIEQLTRTHAEVCERMGAAAIEAHDFGLAIAAEQPESKSAETA